MKKIGVISDTHSKRVASCVIDAFKDVDLIVHAGDFTELADFDFFKNITKIKSVYGNMDEADIRNHLKEREIFEVEGVRIGLIHGFGPPKKVPQWARHAFIDENVDVIIFGHSHEPFNKKIDDVLMFNPGSATDFMTTSIRSFGILKIDGRAVEGAIIQIKD